MDIKRIRHNILVLLRLCLNKDYRRIRRLYLFDGEYYRRIGKGVNVGTEDPLWDYIRRNSRLRDFEDRGFSEWVQQADPHPLFDIAYYLIRYFPEGIDRDPFAHYLEVGWEDGYWPSPFFDPETYSLRSGWDRSSGNPLIHYTRIGAGKGISPSPHFDIDWYIDNTPVLFKVKHEIIRHYKLYGAIEGKSPVPRFDPEYYLSQLPDPTHAKRDPFSHYAARIDNEGLKPDQWFDPAYYEEQNQSGKEENTALAHYLSEGLFAQRYINRNIESLQVKPIISIIVPVYNPELRLLNMCIRSVLYQIYPHWELCLADDCSTDESVRKTLEEWAVRDVRIKVVFNEANRGISFTSNRAAELAKGEFLGFLDNDDELSPDCLYFVARSAGETGADVLYSDEDLIRESGQLISTFYKPDFNPELLLSHNYITHFVVVRRELFDTIGGFRDEFNGAQDFDLMLRLSECAGTIQHIDKILYHWRAAQTSTSLYHEQKEYAHEAGKKALEEAIARRNMPAAAESTELKFYYRVRYQQIREPLVSVILPPVTCQPGLPFLGKLVKKTGYRNVELIFPQDSPSFKAEVKSVMADSSGDKGWETIFLSPEKSRAEGGDRAVAASSGEYIVIIGANGEDIRSDWLEEMLAPIQHNSEIGMVAGRVYFGKTDGPSYTVPDITNNSAKYYAAFLQGYTRHMNGHHCPQLVNCCNDEFVLMSRSNYDRLTGFDYENFPNLFYMHDLSFRFVESGMKGFYTPYAHLIIGEEESYWDGIRDHADVAEKRLFKQKWEARLSTIDPYYNRGLLEENDIDWRDFLGWLSDPSFERKP